jgi:cytochrome P450
MHRYVHEDFVFSDGTTVPAGSIVGVPSSLVHQDPNVYEDPTRFDGFRFVKMKERVDLDGHFNKKFDLVTINPDFVGFGQGRHACPGRFFAAAAVKLMLAHIVTNYDVKLADGAERPADFVRMNTALPSRTAEIYFRKRQ